jgi:hypothetical protein
VCVCVCVCVGCGGSGLRSWKERLSVVVGFDKVAVCVNRSREDSRGRVINEPAIFSTRLKVKDCLHSWEHLSLETKKGCLRPLVLIYLSKDELFV